MQSPIEIATPIAQASNVTRVFRTGSGTIQVLHNIDLSIAPGEFVALRGRSGSGKTTFLNILVGLDDPTQGRVNILGQELATLNEAARAELRRRKIGLLFQNAHLFPSLTARENVEVALRLLKMPARARNKRSLETLELVGLSKRAQHRALELSGGEQQRVALARALVHTPRFIVADEPTGNLDSVTGQNIVALLREIARQTGVSLLIATHDATVFTAADRIVHMNDGSLIQ